MDELPNLPEWAEGSSEKVEHYYTMHQETKLDKFLKKVACRLGVIVHGDLNQEQLEDHLKQFDIQSLLCEGCKENAFLSLAAQTLILSSLECDDRIYDMHLHNLGYDEGNYLNPKSSAHKVAPFGDYLTFMTLRYAAGMSSPISSTQNARRRIQLYTEHFPKLCAIILPVHPAILEDGTLDWQNTGSYLDNDAAIQTAFNFSNTSSEIIPAISVHPFDKKWREKLHWAHSIGIRLVKWMPPQSIPPDSELLNPYYQTLKDLNMVIVAHSGPEHTIPTNKENMHWADFGNPLRFRNALQMGVNVILAHCGHKDKIIDLDDPHLNKVPGHELFFRLAREAHQKNLSGEWEGKLYGDLAAVTTHYGTQFIKQLLLYTQEDGVRLIYGSDYPFTNLIKPKMDAYDGTAQAKLLNPEHVKPLKEIRNWNPLLANYIFTKNLRHTTEEGIELKFPESTFTGKFTDGELILYDKETWDAFKSR